MAVMARLSHKAKIYEDNGCIIYLIKKGEIKEGIVDINRNLKVVSKNNAITSIPRCDDKDFLLSDKSLCYSNVYDKDEILTCIEGDSKPSLYQNFKSFTDVPMEFMVYHKKEDKVVYLEYKDVKQFLDAYKLSDMLETAKKVKEEVKAQIENGSAQAQGVYSDELEDDYLEENTQNDGSDNEPVDIDKMHVLLKYEDNFVMTLPYEELKSFYALDDDTKLEKIYKIIGQFVPEDELNKIDEQLEQENTMTIEEIKEQIDNMIGMQNVKDEVNALFYQLAFNIRNKEETLNLNLEDPKLNMVFYGNPGTGKTTVARLISMLYHKLGYTNGLFREVRAGDCIAGYMGQTELKTRKLIESVKGGVLFLDEAYALTQSGKSSFGDEALTPIMQELSDGTTVFIFAGYRKEMEEFIKSNSGLVSRFNYLEFNDYTTDELLQMLMNKIDNGNFLIEKGFLEEAKKIIEQAITKDGFGNGRFIDKLYSDIVKCHSINAAIIPKGDIALTTLSIDDISKVNIDKLIYDESANVKKIGFR